MKISIFALCDYAINNQGKLSVMGMFNRIPIKQFPSIYNGSFYLVVKLSSSENVDSTLEIKFLSPSGQEVLPPFSTGLKLKVNKDDGEECSADYILQFNNQKFQESGTYRFVLKAGDIEATQELYVK